MLIASSSILKRLQVLQLAISITILATSLIAQESQTNISPPVFVAAFQAFRLPRHIRHHHRRPAAASSAPSTSKLSFIHCSSSSSSIINYTNIRTSSIHTFTNTNNISNMPRGIKKENLPFKTCITCNRPFTWRKKWEKCWEEVTTCSKSCNRDRKRRQQQQQQHQQFHSSSSSRLFMQQHNEDQEEHQGVDNNGSNDEDVDAILDVDDAESVNSTGAFSSIPVPKAFDLHEEEGLDQQESDSNHQSRNDNNDDNIDDNIDDESNVEISNDNVEQLLKELNLLSNNSDGDDEDKDVTNLDSITQTPNSNSTKNTNSKNQLRKAQKKQKKQERRLQREGKGDPSVGQKQCDMCSNSVDLLIRCTYDASLDWKMVCGKCWNVASGGVVDGDASHPYYRYGGLWKNRKRK